MPNPELSSTRGPIEIYQRCAGAGDAAALLSRPRHRCLQPELKLEPELIHQPERAFTSTAHSRCWRRCSSGGARGRGRSDKTDCCGTWQEGEQRRAGVESSAAASRAGEMEHIFPGVGADGAWCYSLRGFSRGRPNLKSETSTAWPPPPTSAEGQPLQCFGAFLQQHIDGMSPSSC